MEQDNIFSQSKCKQFIQTQFDNSALPSIIQYIKIPNLSRNFDKEWMTNGLLQKAAQHIKNWVDSCEIPGKTTQIIKIQNLSPIIFTQIKGEIDETYFFYGHYDKQPPSQGWLQGLGPTIPVIRDDKLYGRGGADDGYSTYGTILAIKALKDQGLPTPRCVMITEGDEQSGSGHIYPYVELLKQRIGQPKLCFCLDSGALDYERLWITTSLRGVLSASIRVDVVTESCHSGQASGIVPSSFRIIRSLLSRLQNEQTGQMHEGFSVEIPPNRYKQMYELSKQKKQDAIKELPIVQDIGRVNQNILSSLILRGWAAQLVVIGIDGVPKVQGAGNVMLPFTQVKISIRLPPSKNPKEAQKNLIKLMTQNPPYKAKVKIANVICCQGFNAPDYDAQLESIIQEASKAYYGLPKLSLCEGMSIPMLNLLRDTWPKAKFIVTGVLGPKSNAHGPNQFLHLPYVKKLICCMAHIVAKSTLKNSN